MSSSRVVVTCAALIIIGLAGVAESADSPLPMQNGAAPLLFTPSDVVALPPSPDEPAVVRRQAVQANASMLSDLPAGSGRRARLDLFTDSSFVVLLNRVIHRSTGRFTWFGYVEGDKLSSVTLVVEQGVVAGLVQSTVHGLFEIHSDAAGSQIVDQLDQSQFAPCACGPEHIVQAQAANPPILRGAECLDDGSLIDVLVAYTPAARASAGGTTQIEALIQASIDVSNSSYASSQVNTQLRLAHMTETSYTESGSFSTDLSRLRSLSDGHMDEVHGLRNDYGADLVALIRQPGGYCGIAYLMNPLSSGFASSGFSVTSRTCAAGNLTFPHELGHNMGCAHDHDNAGGAAFFYAYGHRFDGNSTQWRTVMAYSPGTRIQRFSNPDVIFDGTATGVPIDQADPAHNALSINNAAETVANFRSVGASDCNENGIFDCDDIALGTSLDEDADLIPDECQRVLVDAAATGLGTGLNWADAYSELDSAFADVESRPGLIKSVWVAAGTYRPTSAGGDRTATFFIPEGVTVYGGFTTGSETLLSERNWAANPTILSGDLSGNDIGFTNNGENSYHVVSSTLASATGIPGRLDGFTIEGGNADGIFPDSAGGGVNNSAGDLDTHNCIIQNNSADLFGGGYLRFSAATGEVANCSFLGNVADNGAALFGDVGTLTIVNSSFSDNHATTTGGGVSSTGGTINIFNSIFWGNTDAGGSDESAQINVIGTVTVDYSDVQGLTGGLGGTGNIGSDPQFADAALRLGPGSPCIDAGDNGAVPSDVTTDLDGGARFIDDPASPDTGAGGAPLVDMGAYEAPPGAAGCATTAARSCNLHGATTLCLDILANDIEPRQSGVTQVEIDVDSGSATSATVTCVDSGAYGGVASVSQAGSTVTIDLAPALPDGDACTITLDCGASVCLRGLAGDIDRNGVVSTGDASIIKPHFGESATVAGAEFDFDQNDIVSTGDASIVKPLFGNAATACP